MAKRIVHIALCAVVGSVPVWALPQACRVSPYWRDVAPWKAATP
mgnify:CR=1 FL=1